MSIRSELENKLITFCNAQVPKIPYSVEGVAFTKPTTGSYVQCWMLGSNTLTASVDATRTRENGAFQINVCCPDGKGSKQVEDLARQISALYPVAPKELFTELSIDYPTQIGQALIDGTFRVLPLTVRYRQELQA